MYFLQLLTQCTELSQKKIDATIAKLETAASVQKWHEKNLEVTDSVISSNNRIGYFICIVVHVPIDRMLDFMLLDSNVLHCKGKGSCFTNRIYLEVGFCFHGAVGFHEGKSLMWRTEDSSPISRFP